MGENELTNNSKCNQEWATVIKCPSCKGFGTCQGICCVACKGKGLRYSFADGSLGILGEIRK